MEEWSASHNYQGNTPVEPNKEPEPVSHPSQFGSVPYNHHEQTSPQHTFGTPEHIAIAPNYAVPKQQTFHHAVARSVEKPVAVAEVSASSVAMPQDDRPLPVVKVLSVRGVEYALMTFTLWFGAAAIIWMLLALVHGQAGFDMLAFPISLLIVCLPVFAFFFIRLKRAEIAKPALRLEPSKRRFSQLTQFVTFLVCLFNAVAFIYKLVASIGGEYDGSIGKSAAELAVIMAVAGGLFLYYWFDEHRLQRQLGQR